MKFEAVTTRHGKKLELNTGDVTYSMPFESAHDLRRQLEQLISEDETEHYHNTEGPVEKGD